MVNVEPVTGVKITLTNEHAAGVVLGMAAIRQSVESGKPITELIAAEDIPSIVAAGNELYNQVGNRIDQ